MIVSSAYRPAWWLPSRHLMTIWPILFRRRPALAPRLERWERVDGDFNDLAWVGDEAAPDAPLVVVLHGLEGSIDSKYARGVLGAVERRGWRGVLLHFRGCSGEPNRLPRAYHSGDTADLRDFLVELHRRFPDAPKAAAGFSLGGNVLLKYLGEVGSASPLAAAAAVCAPMVLSECADQLQRGASRIYDAYLLRSLKASLRKKRRRVDVRPEVELGAIRSLRAFDDRITAPLHGFEDADDYYAKASSRPLLGRIRAPTLILHAQDDPLMTAAVIPRADELSDAVTLELSERGGHVGFVGGRHPFAARYYLEARVLRFLSPHLRR